MDKQIHLKNNNWAIKLDLVGGRVVELLFKEKLILGTFNRIDGKSGNTHLCFPNFAGEGSGLDLPFHGPVRNALWQLKAVSSKSAIITYLLEATERYPASLEIEQLFSLDLEFFHQIVIRNNGQASVPVNLGIHYYWATAKGWQGTLLNGREATSNIKTNGNTDLLSINQLSFPFEETLNLKAEGFPKAVLWSGFKKEHEETLYDQEYCCIEPVRGVGDFFGSEQSMLKSGEEICCAITLGL